MFTDCYFVFCEKNCRHFVCVYVVPSGTSKEFVVYVFNALFDFFMSLLYFPKKKYNKKRENKY